MVDHLLDERVKAVLISGLTVILGYFPVTLLGYSYNVSYPAAVTPFYDLKRDFGCSSNCSRLYAYTIDHVADGNAIWPVARLAANLYSRGIIPLWNPYLAAGTPLAADSINFAFSPMILFYMLPNSLWDIPLLICLWLAGIFTYLLLRSWRLGFLSSVIGSTIFMLSGAVTWYLPHNSIPVVMFTPLILFSIEKVFQSRDFKYVILGSVAVAFSVLGGHLESIALVLLFCFVYTIFRILHMAFSKSYKQPELDYLRSNGLVNVIQTKKRIILKSLVMLFAGLGLSAFFIIPAAEYVLNGAVGRDIGAGIAYSPAFTIGTTFMPYLLGTIADYVIPATGFATSWNVLGGYVVASSFVFSLLGISFSNQLSQSHLHKRIAQFFFAISVFFMLKSIGIPGINLIGRMPIFDHIVFPRYDGFIYTLGLAISAAFGIEVITQRKIGTRTVGLVTIISFVAIVIMSLLIVPYFTWQDLAENWLGITVYREYYVIFQVFQALFFILISFLLIVAYQRDKRTISALFFLVLLEASLYIPLGLPPIWQFYRAIVVILGVIGLCTASFLPVIDKSISSDMKISRRKIKLVIFAIIAVFTIAGQQIVYLESPQGLRIRDDVFKATPVTEYLRNNLGNSRIFSFDEAFLYNYPASYEVQTLGIVSAQNVRWFNSFFHNILDPYAFGTHFDIPGWRDPRGMPIESTFLRNQRYYDFLGVKYIVAYSTNPNELQTVYGESKFVPIGSNNSISQHFISQADYVEGVEIWFGTYARINRGELILALDSIPFAEKYHRVSIIDAEKIIDGGFSRFEFEPVDGVKGKELSVTLSHPQANRDNAVAVLIDGINRIDTTPQDLSLLRGQLYIDGNPADGTMRLSIFPGEFPLVFSDGGINIYENKDAYPRSFLVHKFQVTDSYENAQSIIKNPDFDLRNEVVLENNLPIEQADLLTSSTLDERSSAKIVLYSSNKVTIDVNSKSASLLILTDTYYPGWHAYVDGKESTIYRADGLVRAIFVPPGNHIVEFSYLPESFVIGVTISLITAGLLAFLILKKNSKSMRARRFLGCPLDFSFCTNAGFSEESNLSANR